MFSLSTLPQQPQPDNLHITQNKGSWSPVGPAFHRLGQEFRCSSQIRKESPGWVLLDSLAWNSKGTFSLDHRIILRLCLSYCCRVHQLYTPHQHTLEWPSHSYHAILLHFPVSRHAKEHCGQTPTQQYKLQQHKRIINITIILYESFSKHLGVDWSTWLLGCKTEILEWMCGCLGPVWPGLCCERNQGCIYNIQF